jgi:hypothetical protein
MPMCRQVIQLENAVDRDDNDNEEEDDDDE